MDDIRGSFPKEIIDLIVPSMDARTKRMMRSTSKYWHKYIQFDSFKVYFARPATLPAIVQHFTDTYPNKPIGLSLEKIVLRNGEIDQLMFHPLSNMTQLTSLQFNFNVTTHRSATMLTNLTNLVHLPRIHATDKLTNLTSLIVGEKEQILPLYTNLRDVSFSVTDASVTNSFGLIANPSALTSLSLEFQEIIITEDDANVMTQFANLKKLDVRPHLPGRFIPGLFQYLTDLEILIVGGLQDDVFKLTRLTELAALSSAFDAQQLTTLQNIRKLHLRCLKHDENYMVLTALTALESFDAQCLKTTADGLKFMNAPNLTKLSLGQTSENLNLDHLSRMTTLLDLIIVESGNAPRNYGALSALGNLTRLHISTPTPNALFAVLATLTRLKSLYLETSETQLHEDISLSTLINLELLTLDIGGSLPQLAYDSLGNLTRLTSLRIKSSEMEEGPGSTEEARRSPVAIAHLPMKILDLECPMNSNELWSVVTTLTDLEELQVVDIDSEEVIESFSVLTNLKILKIGQSYSVKGVHLTKLTSLQGLTFISQQAQALYGEKNSTGLSHLTRLVYSLFDLESF